MMIYMPIVAALIGLAYMWIKRSWVLKQDAGDGRNQYQIEITKNIIPPTVSREVGTSIRKNY